jgi:oligopeptide transport system ATP-binding protein
MPLLEVHHLRVSFYTRNGIVRAVNDVSFQIDRRETLAIVGESGSGKSVSCYALLGLIAQPPGKIEGGHTLYGGKDLLACSSRQLQQIRGKRISMIFQDPMTSLNPYMRIEDQLIEPLLIHDRLTRRAALERAIHALVEVGIQDAAQRIRCYPHEFSGGMRQRVMIAMALITRPDLLIADEPTTALDVTVQAQILELIKKRQNELGMAVILVSHDLGVVSGFCDRVLVMYAGQLMESSPTDALFYRPLHPYNQALQKSRPALQAKGSELFTIAGMPPDLSKPIIGCAFAPRCEFAKEECRQTGIRLSELEPDHQTACLRVQRGELKLQSVAPLGPVS